MAQRSKMRQRPIQSLKAIRPDAAGIDLGSREHWVAGPPGKEDQPNIQSFGTTTPELYRLSDWLKEQSIKTVAMESTGVYWIPLFEILDKQGFDVVLANARQISHVPGRKTDILDCQWIQLLHACGLLHGSFRPSDDICHLRALLRERNMMVDQRSDWIRRMQKNLDQMNICVHHAVTDITGVTGMNIIRAIVDGERNPKILAAMRDRRCKKTEEEIADELTGNWRQEHLFNLDQALKMYDHVSKAVDEYDKEILSYIESMQSDSDPVDPDGLPSIPKSKAKNIAKKGQGPLRQALYKLSGIDLTAIDSIGVDTAALIISELGLDFSPFPGEAHFVAYLRLAPNLSISAGRKVPNRFKATTSTRVSAALRMCAITLRNSKTALGAYFRRISYRKGASVAVFSTARKLAQIIYRLVRYGQPYVDMGSKQYEARYEKRRINYHTKALEALGFEIKPLATTEATSVV